uniref:Murine leukemia virus integrase C-terminal domain-containing protein n=1 Tax=Rousettus aegyptiacus TaxID=9407 RepID=A0A7J8JH01_ROUAE|nr:hypothetical protein HJG63_010177 [Rousettus aegyptiacus]
MDKHRGNIGNWISLRSARELLDSSTCLCSLTLFQDGLKLSSPSRRPLRPQGSGQVERMNRTLKETLTKFKLETGKNWETYPELLAQYPVQPHNHAQGDWIWVRKVQLTSLEPRWDGPFPVILTTPNAVKVARHRHRIHRTRIKAAHPPQTSEKWVLCQTEDPLKIRLSRVQSGPS